MSLIPVSNIFDIKGIFLSVEIEKGHLSDPSLNVSSKIPSILKFENLGL
ncbi:hypothetical protein XBO1_1370002 [Xenorhabdus bovienii str. oregonense]|uniref:Uncharacterized protein n=1 Tax=Xenorhabdus bovienii str. oregonense TaxID=1398202 RepID=A0A077P4H1_XENBV|nr:hypothetical protein XBO1_1370002 [Xenorhabdus bovienii str. oregonense]